MLITNSFKKTSTKPIAITAGEPSSISAVLLFKGWYELRYKPNISFFSINNIQYLEEVKKQLNYSHIPIKQINSPLEALTTFKNSLPVIDIPIDAYENNKVVLGKPNFKHVSFVIKSIDTAINFVKNNYVNAITTMPIEKWVMQNGGFNFIGHTEYLAYKSSIKTPIMLMASPYNKLKVVPIKIHISLSNSIKTLNIEEIITSVQIINTELQKYLKKNITIAILGLNPHAGEQGIMGNEEQDIIIPATTHLKKYGINVVGPLPPDTAFTKDNINQFDVIVGMYHDQVLTPFKALLFEEGVNVTLGLPYIRTSPDHGTALDIAPKNIANAKSFIASVVLANMWQH